MNDSTYNCPRNNAWCTQHLVDEQQCGSLALEVSTSVHVWLLQEMTGLEPVIIVDVPPAAGELSIADAAVLCSAVERLRQAVLTGTAVKP